MYTNFFRIVFSVLLLLLLIGTIIDVKRRYSLERNNKDISSNKLIKTFISFSIYSNTISLLNTKSGKNTIECFNGFRLISLLFIIILHTYLFTQFPSGK